MYLLSCKLLAILLTIVRGWLRALRNNIDRNNSNSRNITQAQLNKLRQDTARAPRPFKEMEARKECTSYHTNHGQYGSPSHEDSCAHYATTSTGTGAIKPNAPGRRGRLKRWKQAKNVPPFIQITSSMADHCMKIATRLTQQHR